MKGMSGTFCCVAALLILTMTPGDSKALTEEEQRQRDMRRDIELGLLAIEPPQPDDTLIAMDFGINIPQAEEDRDHLYHPRIETPKKIRRTMLKLERKIINGPEEDRDHLYHP
ncbi:proline-rich acidic protein 1 [Discoglossus pictus]